MSEPVPDTSDETESPTDDARPVVSVSRHTVAIDDQRDSNGYEHGLEWVFSIENGVITGFYRGHWLEGKTQSDPMLSVGWEEVPELVKRRLRQELNVVELETDLPAPYGGEP